MLWYNNLISTLSTSFLVLILGLCFQLVGSSQDLYCTELKHSGTEIQTLASSIQERLLTIRYSTRQWWLEESGKYVITATVLRNSVTWNGPRDL